MTLDLAEAYWFLIGMEDGGKRSSETREEVGCSREEW